MIELHVIRIDVMATMRGPPGKVWRHERGMQKISGNVVSNLGREKAPMPVIVSDYLEEQVSDMIWKGKGRSYPEASHDDALREAVDLPGYFTSKTIADERDSTERENREESSENQVTREQGQCFGPRGLEALRRDGQL